MFCTNLVYLCVNLVKNPGLAVLNSVIFNSFLCKIFSKSINNINIIKLHLYTTCRHALHTCNSVCFKRHLYILNIFVIWDSPMPSRFVVSRFNGTTLVKKPNITLINNRIRKDLKEQGTDFECK